MITNNDLFEIVKKNKINEFQKILNKNNNIDLNIKDEKGCRGWNVKKP